MKKVFILSLLIISLSVSAQTTGSPMYVAAKSGLSIREKPDAGAKVLDKIPYGTKITLIDEDGGWVEIVTEGMVGYWRKVKYNNKTGYIVDSYLFPWPPPKLATVKGMKQYLAQVALPVGQKLVTRSGTMKQLTESGWELSKQLYKNGAEHHLFLAYEYGSDIYFLPGFTLQQGFLLCRLIPEFKEIFGEKDEFPTASKKFTKGEIEYEIEVRKLADDPEYGGPFTIEKIRVGYGDGAYIQFEMYIMENQLVIFLSAGV
ncbi:MAG: SH3 domain-containing protein [Chitinophagaceae bacterium]|jgi:thioredoxin-related protein|nr:SH3 domain-containing protein [Chitinophagaceae bacterium]MBK8301376.1 SH3 domain-containing protein [Chitinophagaceae bacterium]MBK9658296.1 SH3 domain-containing protein [Chitinophagaceae bacterium]MBK9938592.1 SH3 domain-containing protein [Chitinophagaceae bacterium]MBP6234269.1 SH3 domain-containing protein [Chitinophagaceae bacterium]